MWQDEKCAVAARGRLWHSSASGSVLQQMRTLKRTNTSVHMDQSTISLERRFHRSTKQQTVPHSSRTSIATHCDGRRLIKLSVRAQIKDDLATPLSSPQSASLSPLCKSNAYTEPLSRSPTPNHTIKKEKEKETYPLPICAMTGRRVRLVT